MKTIQTKIIKTVQYLLLTVMFSVLLQTQKTEAQIPCHASFGYFTSGNVVQFLDSSYTSSGACNYAHSYWSFGNGITQHFSYTNSPSQTFANGTYQVCLHIMDSVGIGCVDSFCQTITIGNTCGYAASFTYNTNSNVVSFTNTSTGSFTSSTWNIDGGYKYITTNTVDTFFSAGVHTVCLSIRNNNGSCVDSFCQTINITSIPNGYPISGYIYNDANNNHIMDAGETGIANQSVNVVLVGGGFVTVQTDALGFYQTTVIGGNYVFSPNLYMNGYTQTQPTFGSYTGVVSTFIVNMNFGFYSAPCPTIFSATAATQGLGNYLFTDSITNNNSGIIYNWYYGDGTSGLTSSHTYLLNGTYTPSLAIYNSMNPNCHDSFALTPIVVSGLTACAGQAYFTAYANACGGGYYFYPTNQVSGTTYSWDFGDGSALSTNTYPSHTYANSNNYTVTLISYNAPNNCYDTSSQSVSVSIVAAPVSGFTYSINSNTITCTNTSTGSIANYYWNYDDGGSSSLMNPPTHTFLFGGQHWVALSVNSAGGCSDSLVQYFNISIPNADTLTGNVFNDINNNGIKDVGELGIANQYIYLYAQGTSTYTYTDVVGKYSFILPSGTDSIYAPNIWMYSRTLPLNTDHYVVTTTGNQHLSGFDFGYVDTVSTIAGHVFFDTNGNGTQDAGELNASAIRVDVYGNTMSTHVYTDYFGNYTALLYYGNGTYNITCNPVLSGYTGYNISTSPTQYNVTTSNATTYNGNDFGLNPISSTTGDNLMVNITPANTAVPGYGAWYYVTVKNIGSTTVGGNVVFNYDPSLIFVNAINGTNNSTTNQVSWVVSSLSPGAYSQNTIVLNVASTTSLGTALTHNASVVLSSGTDVDLSNNAINYQQVVVGSYDPNEKTVSPVGEGANGAINPNNNGELTYTIRFQNTGTAPAINIVVKDVIDADLDLNTLQMLESSNNNTLSVDDVTRLATWKFQNIMLADSNHDEPHSHGYLQFKIKLKSGLTQNTALNNTANIYFDFNAAVITNTTTNTVDYALGVNDIVDGNLPTISVAPNPMNEFTTIRIDGLKGTADVDVTITNLLGEQVKTLTHQTNIITLKRNELSSGIYFYELKNNGNKIGNGKIVME
ncbi:MAG: hypothetical protein RI955_724 [Bacteroidota bacterium]